jgi:hypothetical protein
MTTATLRMPVSLPEKRTALAPGFFARLHAAFVAARMRTAMRELARHRHLIPADVLKEAGYTATPENNYPFTR